MKPNVFFFLLINGLLITAISSCESSSSKEMSNHEFDISEELVNENSLPTVEDLEQYKIHAYDFKREFCVYNSTSRKSKGPLPLVLVLHGGRGHMKNFARKTNWMRLAKKEGFIVAFLQAQKLCIELDGSIEKSNFWLTDEKKNQLCPNFKYHDDSDYLDLVMVELHKNYSIDFKRVYAAGFSNGMGYLMKKVLKKKPSRFAALGGAGSLTYRPYKGHTEMPVMMIIGQKDPRLTKHSQINAFPMVDQYSIFHDPTQRVCLSDLTAYLQVGKDDYDWKLDDEKMVLNFYPDVEHSRSFLKYMLIKDLTHRFPNGEELGKNLDGAVLLWNFFKQYKLEE